MPAEITTTKRSHRDCAPMAPMDHEGVQPNMSRTQGTCTTTGQSTDPPTIELDPEYAELVAESARTGKSIVRLIGDQIQDAAINAAMVAEDAVGEQIAELGLEEWEYWIFEPAVERVVAAGGPNHIDVAEIVANEVAQRKAFMEFYDAVLTEYGPGSDWRGLMGGLLASAAAGGRLPGVSDEDRRRLVEQFPTITWPSGACYHIATGEFVLGENPSPAGPTATSSESQEGAAA